MLTLAEKADLRRSTMLQAALNKKSIDISLSRHSTSYQPILQSSSVRNQQWRTEELGTREQGPRECGPEERINKNNTVAQISPLAKPADDERVNASANTISFTISDPDWHWAEYTELTSWYLSLSPVQLPIPPFPLSECAVVTGEKFFTNLKNEIALGAKSHRARNGLLQDHLKLLRKVVDAKTGVNVRQDDILDIKNTNK